MQMLNDLSSNFAKSLQLCLTLSDPMDCSLPGSSIHGIFQARVVEWGAIVFSIPATLEDMNNMVILGTDEENKIKVN